VSSLVGTASLVRLALRRDRVILPVCIAIFVALVTSSTSATIALYPTVTSRVQAAASLNNTASLVAFYGRIYDGTSLGAVAMLKMGGIGTALVAVLALLTVIRHTRAEEESGRLELLGAAVVGRHAPLTAALLVAVGSSLVLGGLTALGLFAVGLPAAGSIAFGLAWAGVGAAFAALAAVAAQLTRSARAASGIAGAALGLSYLLRAIGDSSSGQSLQWLSWLSPIGWGQQARPFAGERWWVMTLLFGVAVALAAGGLRTRRPAGSRCGPVARPGGTGHSGQRSAHPARAGVAPPARRAARLAGGVCRARRGARWHRFQRRRHPG
jgi:ABC-2 type transport system permease protein